MRLPYRITTQVVRTVRRRVHPFCFPLAYTIFCFALISQSILAQTKTKTPEPAGILIGRLDHQRDVPEAPSTRFYPGPEGLPDGVLSCLLEPDSRTHRNEFVKVGGGVYKRRDVVSYSFSQKTHHFGDTPSVLHLLVDNSNEITQATLSPTGRYLMVREGFYVERDTSPDKLFVWDAFADRLVCTYKDGNLFWPVTRWSPDERYLAFIRGGDREGFVSGAADMGQVDMTRTLTALSVSTGKVQDVGTGMGTLSFEWLPDSTLLYGECQSVMVGETYCNRVALKTSRIDTSKSGQFHAEKPVSLVTDASTDRVGAFYSMSAGTVSADGRLLAFFGWPDAKEMKRAKKLESEEGKSTPPAGLGLYLFDRALKTRKRLGNWNQGTLTWTPDGKLLLLSSAYADGAKLQRIDLTRYSQAATLQLHGEANDSRTPLFVPKVIGITKNARFLIVTTNGQITNPDVVPGRGESITVNVANVLAIEINTGAVSRLATLVSAYVMGWREGGVEHSPTAKPYATKKAREQLTSLAGFCGSQPGALTYASVSLDRGHNIAGGNAKVFHQLFRLAGAGHVADGEV